MLQSGRFYFGEEILLLVFILPVFFFAFYSFHDLDIINGTNTGTNNF